MKVTLIDPGALVKVIRKEGILVKKLIALALVFVVVSCGLVGCGGGSPAPKAPTKPAAGGGEEPK